MNVARRAIPSVFNFPGDADASKFLDDVPAGVLPYEQVQQWGGYSTGTSYLDPSWTAGVNIWGSGGTLYIKGNCDFTNRKFYVGSNTEVFLVRGATLTLGAESDTEDSQRRGTGGQQWSAFLQPRHDGGWQTADQQCQCAV